MFPESAAVAGDVAWGGNWFFLISDHDQIIDLQHVDALTDFAWRVRAAVNAQGHPLVDHVELFVALGYSPASIAAISCFARARPTTARPAAPGTSAKLACLAADGKLPKARSGCRKA